MRRLLPWSLMWIAHKGRRGCGCHEWYKHDDETWHCYCCVVGVKKVDSDNANASRNASPQATGQTTSTRWLIPGDLRFSGTLITSYRFDTSVYPRDGSAWAALSCESADFTTSSIADGGVASRSLPATNVSPTARSASCRAVDGRVAYDARLSAAGRPGFRLVQIPTGLSRYYPGADAQTTCR